MKTKYAIIFVLINALAFISLLSCESSNDNQTSYPVGEFSWEKWQSKAGWDDYSASDYTPSSEYISKILTANQDRNISFIIFTASWCPDSKSETPKIYKLFNALNTPLTSSRLFGVDRDKIEPTKTYLTYDLLKVPTLIVIEDGEEIGRIVEYPIKTWEEDLLKILEK